MRSVEAPTPTSAAAPGAQATAAPSGWTKRVTAMVGLSKKPSVERGRVVISAPSNFTHVKCNDSIHEKKGISKTSEQPQQQ